MQAYTEQDVLLPSNQKGVPITETQSKGKARNYKWLNNKSSYSPPANYPASQPWVASIPPNYPPYNPLPPNYYPMTQPPPPSTGISTMGAVGLGAVAGMGVGALAASSTHPRPYYSSYHRPYRTTQPRNNRNQQFRPKYEAPPPCPPGKTVGPYDTVCTLPDCPKWQTRLPNGDPCKLPYCPFNQKIGPNGEPCQLPPCLPGYKVGPWGSLCALPPCPPGQKSGPFGALCQPQPANPIPNQPTAQPAANQPSINSKAAQLPPSPVNPPVSQPSAQPVASTPIKPQNPTAPGNQPPTAPANQPPTAPANTATQPATAPSTQPAAAQASLAVAIIQKRSKSDTQRDLKSRFFQIYYDYFNFIFELSRLGNFHPVINKTYTMASLAKRKQKVNELRKAHFPFGFQNNQNATSEYKQEYLEHPIEHPPSVADKNSHFTIGSDQPSMAKNTYQSQFKQQFPGYAPQSRSTQKKTNDDNNIVLGFEPTKTNTNYRDQFALKEGDRGKQVNQRIVSIELGDTLTDFTTSYKKNFDGAQAPRTEKIDNNTGKTNLVLGYDQPAFTTTHSTSHAPKPFTTNKNVQRSYGTNIVFGGDSGNFHSENKTQFAHKQANYQKVDKERVLDFKSAHFKFGFPQQQQENVSQAQAHYNAKPLSKIQLQGKKPVNVELRHDDNNYFQSSYGEHFQKKQPSKAQILNKNGRNTNVIIGLGKETYNSQAKDQFVAKNVERVKGKGAQGSIELGDGSRDFTTQYKQTFVDKNADVQRNKVSKEDIDKMRAQSYVVGFAGPDYQLHSMSYGQAPGETNKLSRQTIDKMRGTNIVYGNSEFQAKSIHSSSYGWKKNDDF